MKYKYFLSFFILGFCFLAMSIPSPSMAEPGRSAYFDYEEGESTDEYLKPTYKRLSQLYWALAMYELSDTEAIDGYLYINECELYHSYLDKDFELSDLRQATRESLMKNLAFFPTKFEIIMPVGLDRYDTGKEQFSLDPGSYFLSSKRLEVSQLSNAELVCQNGTMRRKYPNHFILEFAAPFSLTDFHVSPEVAEMYLASIEKKNLKGVIPKDFSYFGYNAYSKLSKFNRVVFLRLKVTITQFKKYESNYNQEMVPAMFAVIDGFDIYADVEKTLPLYIDSFSKDDDNKYHGRGKARMTIPDGQLIPEPESDEEEPKTQAP